ncbi:hypothetical protein L1987_57907 [Smallanthus sonchifolius]|uniref:Uncharacterized protein n=1 Tax=Smallanthus sonchifolius TaxID=185202 RepID=A0ACB9DDU9_9ASTR|nr:hypothetical protein L1987_57907 [Smallanthus sonchifolius]
MPAAIADAMQDVGKMLGKGRWVSAESDEEPKEETIGEKIINDEGLGAEIESEEINLSKRHIQNYVEMEGMKGNVQQKAHVMTPNPELKFSRLSDAISRLSDAISRLSDAISRLSDAISRLSDAISRLSDANSRLSDDHQPTL